MEIHSRAFLRCLLHLSPSASRRGAFYFFFLGKNIARLRAGAGASNAGVFLIFRPFVSSEKRRVSLLTELENVFE